MGYVYLSDSCYDAPEVIALSAPSVGLYVRGICWQSKYQTEGIVPPHVVPYLTTGGSRRWVNELLREGLWVELPDGTYSIPQEVNGRHFWKPGPKDTYRRPISDDLRDAVYQRDGHACLHCGATKALSLDHIHPYSLGGPDTLENLQTLCRPCNSRKGARVDVT